MKRDLLLFLITSQAAKNLVGGLREVLSHALEEGPHHVFLVAPLIELGHIDPVMPALPCGVLETQYALVHHSVEEEYDGGARDGLARA